MKPAESHKLVDDTLAALGDSPDRVRHALVGLGVRGRPRCREKCPVAVLLRRVIPGACDVEVHYDHVLVGVQGHYPRRFELSDAIRRFILVCDSGAYQDLHDS